MNNSKYEKKRRTKVTVLAVIIIAALILSLAAPLFTAFSQTIEEGEKTASQPSFKAASENVENEPVELTVDAGFDGKFVIGKSTPLTISLESTKSFKGEVAISISSPEYEYDNSRYIYFSPIDLNENLSKKIRMNIFIPYNTNFIEVSVTDSQKNTLVRKRIQIEPVNSTYISTGVISDDLEKLKYLKNIEMEDSLNKISGFKTFFLNKNQVLGISNEELENFDVLIINDFDSGNYNESNLKNIKNWINNGGMLVLSSTDNSYKEANGLKNIINFSSFKEIYLDDIIDDNVEKTIEINALSKVLFKSQELESLSDFPIASEISMGKGKVLIQNFDLANFNTEYSTDEAKDINRFLNNFYFKNFPQKIIYKTSGEMYYNDIYNILDNTPLFKTNMVTNLFIIIIIYIIIIFPLLYIILKRYDKREFGWLIIPVLSLFVTITIFSLSSDSFYKKGIVNTVSIVNVEDNNTFGDVLNYTAVKSPEKGDVTYTNNKKINANLGDSRTYRYSSKEINYRILQGESNKTSITFEDNIRWNTNYFSSNFLSDLNGNMAAYFKLVDNRIEGRIENKTGYDFYNTVLNINGNFVKIDSLEKGKSIDISYTFDELKTENIDDFINNSFEKQEEIKEKVKAGKISEAEANKLIKRGNILKYYNDSKMTEYNYNVKFLNSKSFYIEMYAFNNNLLLGDETLINDKPVNEVNDNIYVFDFNVDYNASQNFEIPYNFIKPEIISIDGDTDIYYKDYKYAVEDGSASEIKCSFKIPNELNANGFQIRFSNKSDDDSMIFNYSSNKWEILKASEYTNALDYINNENKIIIKSNIIDKENINFPEIKVKGVN